MSTKLRWTYGAQFWVNVTIYCIILFIDFMMSSILFGTVLSKHLIQTWLNCSNLKNFSECNKLILSPSKSWKNWSYEVSQLWQSVKSPLLEVNSVSQFNDFCSLRNSCYFMVLDAPGIEVRATGLIYRNQESHKEGAQHIRKIDHHLHLLGNFFHMFAQRS